MSEAERGSAAAELVTRIGELAPLIADHAQQAEQERKPVDEVIAALAQTGVFKACVPRRFGGYEIDIDTFIDVGLAVSEACTSTGWVTTFYMEHNWMLAQFPPETQQAIFGAQPYILAPASISPNGKAQAVDGGHRISGRWPWGTGVMHADWVILNGVVTGDQPDPRLFLVPRSQIEVADTWYCDGMEGTGSNDMIATDVFVPQGYSESLSGMAVGRGSGAVWHDSPCYRHPMLPLLAIAAATPAVGAARRSLELFRERLGGRVLYGTASKQAQRQAAQIRLGDVAARVDASETLLRKAGHDLQAWGHQPMICPAEERARLRVTIAQVVRACRDVIIQIMEASGASAHLKPHPMQRIHRDVNTLSCHTVFDLEIGAENYGRLLLGLDPASPV